MANEIEESTAWRLVEPILRGLSDPAVVVRPDLSVAARNSAFDQLVGQSPRTLSRRIAAGVRVGDLITFVDGDESALILKSFRTNRVGRLAEIDVRSADGRSCIVWLTTIPVVDDQDRVVAVIAHFRDVSAEARMQARFKELLALSQARGDELERLVEMRTRELSAAFEEVRRLARTDPLTGLLNRRAFTELVANGIAAARRHERCAALIMCDLDHFKRVNDELGHRAGDIVLAASAQVLKRTFRNIDSLCRFGGEEFVVFLGDATAEGALQAAERARELLEKTAPRHRTVPSTLRQTASFGVALYPADGTTLDELIGCADSAMYVAKKMGRNRVVRYERRASGLKPSATNQHILPRTPTETSRAAQRAASGTIELERLLIIDSDPERQARYKEAVGAEFDVACVSTPLEALAQSEREEFGVYIADMNQSEHSGMFVLGELLRQQPGAIRVLMVENAHPFEQLLGTNLATIDYVLLRDDYRHLMDAIENCRARRSSYRTNPLARGARTPGWVFHVNEIEEIIATGRFDLALQPIVSADKREVFAHEVLCRLPEACDVQLEEFFDWAVREGAIWRLGRAIRSKAVNHLEEHRSAVLFFNLHAAELLDPHLTLRETELDRFAERVIFEVTERAAIGDFVGMRRTMGRLRDRGFRFAIDDLGAGYAGLNSVAMLSPDFIKVDMTITRDIDQWPVKARLMRSVVSFADEAGVKVVAEGIQTEDEARVIAETGCHYFQGFLVGRPTLMAHPAVKPPA